MPCMHRDLQVMDRSSRNEQAPSSACSHTMVRTALLLTGQMAVSLLSAQAPLEHAWARRVGSINDGEKLWRIAVDEDGNVFATGAFRGTFTADGISVTSVGGSDILLLKYGPDGELLWARSAGGPSPDIAYGVETDKNGNVYITGAYSGLAVFGDTLVSNIDPDGANLPFSFVARYSENGDLDWVRTMDVGMVQSNYPYAISYAIKLDRLGDLVIVGTYNCTLPSTEDPGSSTMSFGGSAFRTCGFSGYDYTYVQRMDTLGNTEWVHSVGGNTGLGTLQSIAFDAQNDIWAGGNVYSNSGTLYIDGPVDLGLSSATGYTGVALEFSESGDPLSGFLLNSTDVSNVEDLIVAGNGDVYLSGWHRGSLFGSPAASGTDGFLMRVTSSGTPVWTDRLVGVSDDFFSGIATTTVPNELVGGAFYFFQADLAGTTLAPGTGNNSALVRLDTMGNVLELVQPELLSGYSLIADVQSDLFGNFYLCGDVGGTVRFTADTIQCLSQDMYVCKIGPQTSTAVSDRPVAATRDWAVFPDPSDGLFNLAGPERGANLVLLDARGAEIRRWRATGSPMMVDIQDQAPGVYVLLDGTGNHARLMRR